MIVKVGIYSTPWRVVVVFPNKSAINSADGRSFDAIDGIKATGVTAIDAGFITDIFQTKMLQQSISRETHKKDRSLC